MDSYSTNIILWSHIVIVVTSDVNAWCQIIVVDNFNLIEQSQSTTLLQSAGITARFLFYDLKIKNQRSIKFILQRSFVYT